MEEAQEAAVKLPTQRPLCQQIQISDSDCNGDDNDFDVLDAEVDDHSLHKLVVVDNLPVVGPEKFEKLKSVVFRIFSVIKDDLFFMPLDSDTGQTLGYCFIEYNTPQEAELARKNRDGYVMGKVKQYELSVRLFNEFDRILNVTDEWTPPKTEPNVCKENLQEWLLDYKARDQFLICTDSGLEVSWNDIIQLKPDVVQLLHDENEGLVQWSPLGTYLTTTNKQGVSVWGGAKTFKPLSHYSHQEVNLVDFSPAEKYLVTYSSHKPENPQGEYNVVLNIFDIRTGKVKKSFKGSAEDFGISRDKGIPSVAWPLIRWSNDKDNKYFALIGKNAIHVYEREADSFKKCLVVENVKDFSWSPADSVIAIFSPELNSGNQPATVSLIRIPDKQELRQKSLVNVSDCRMYWQSNGEYLAIKVERYTKTRKSTHSGLELFCMKERDIPIETLELENKEKIIVFAWEPRCQKFAVIHGDITRPDISFYSMVTDLNKGRYTKLKTLRDRQANALYWSPTGCFVVLAGMSGFKGQLEFYDAHNLQTIATTEHYMVTNVDWDPSGRYVATSVTTAYETEIGFNIWSFYGRLLYKIPRDHLFQFSWRPRPPSLLSAEKEEEIKKNLRKYSEKYKVKDHDASMYLNELEQQRRKIRVEEWNRRIVEWKRLHEEEKDQRRMLRDEEASEEEDKNIGGEVEIEEVLNVVKEIMAF